MQRQTMKNPSKNITYMNALKIGLIAATMFLAYSCGSAGNDKTQQGNTETSSSNAQDKVVMMTKADFTEKVFNYEQKQEWAYQGDMPCVIDFYADWCKPCKMVAPIMDELAVKYAGKVRFYKINTDNERELSMAFNIQSIPAILFVPMTGQPQMSVGAMSKEDYIKAIDGLLSAGQQNQPTSSK